MVECMHIVMKPAEIALFSAFLTTADSYFEYGMGGSTFLASQCVRKRVAAIDSDPGWVANVRKTIGETTKEIVLSHVDIGEIGAWGNPKGRTHEHRYPGYSRAILDQPDDVDLCLVDGRFRVSCFLTALAHLRPDAILAIHDYRSRPHYFEVEFFARPIAKAETLTLFVRRTDADLSTIRERAEATRLDPR